MKKLRIFAALLFMICAIGIFASCGETLETPTGVVVTEENVITWESVDDTYRYLIQFTDVDDGTTKELKTKELAIPVSEFKLKEGWYELRVKALSGENSGNDSEWSEALKYYKVYDSTRTSPSASVEPVTWYSTLLTRVNVQPDSYTL